MLTYRELRDRISELTEDELNLTATVFVEDLNEYWGITETNKSIGDDILDPNHPILIA